MPVTAWLPGNFQVLSITWCLYCVALSDATETEPTRKPVWVLCVWRLASIINPSPTFLVGISPVKRKSSEFNKFGLAYVNPCPQFEGELYINFQTAVLRTLPLVAAYHSVVVVPFMAITFAIWKCLSVSRSGAKYFRKYFGWKSFGTILRQHRKAPKMGLA